ncbi:hypothetical protein HDU96_001923 [Phlyctochytrium bullatum]|nr:hypothetical protein HDU96_001923 [Phlyctochytrium bullatum]
MSEEEVHAKLSAIHAWLQDFGVEPDDKIIRCLSMNAGPAESAFLRGLVLET